MDITVLFSKIWKTLYKQPRNRWKEERYLKNRLAFVDSIKQETTVFDKEILIIRTDDIGDYILFRNTIELIKKSYPNYKITLVGHKLWKDLGENWDIDFVDEFIWLDKSGFRKNEEYCNEFLKKLSSKIPEILIAPSYSRNPFIDDVIARLIPAQQKWAWQRSNTENKKWLRKYVDVAYTNVLSIPNGFHEFDLNKQFIENVCGQKMELQKPFIDASKLPDIQNLPSQYVILFPGAAAKQKRWSTNNFAAVADSIYELRQVKVVVCGSKTEEYLFDEIKRYATHPQNLINYTGKTDLLQLASVINNCQLIITNDTSAAHIAAALGKNTIALLNGNSYGRFFPYPKNLHNNITAIYPPQITNPPYDWVGMEDMNGIDFNLVTESVKKIICD